MATTTTPRRSSGASEVPALGVSIFRSSPAHADARVAFGGQGAPHTAVAWAIHQPLPQVSQGSDNRTIDRRAGLSSAHAANHPAGHHERLRAPGAGGARYSHRPDDAGQHWHGFGSPRHWLWVPSESQTLLGVALEGHFCRVLLQISRYPAISVQHNTCILSVSC